MTKQKKQLTNKPITANNRLRKRDKDSQEPLAPTTKPIQTKRKVSDLSFFLKKEQSISPPTIEKRFNLLYFLKSTSIQGLALECPNLQKAIQKIKNKISIQRNLLYGVLQRYFQTSKHVMWSDKYKPRNLKQSLHSKTGEKIKIWLRSFYYYRNTVLEQSNSFIDDYFGQNSNTQLKNMREFNWKLKGLVVKGRRGVGKTSTILATAKQIAYQIYNCGNQCNQIKYLKQKNEATQSECVKTKMNKNQSLMQKTNQRITKFAIKNQQNQMETQAKKIQFMHNVNNFYPEEDEIKFYNELKKTIDSSKIPFLMTLTGSHLPQSLQIYDVIDFQEATNEEIGALFSLIYHIEKSFQKCIDLQTTVEKERFKQALNNQLESFQFQILTPFADFVRLTQTFNKKFDSLLSFIQISKRVNNPLNIEEAQRALKLYLNRSDPQNLLSDYFSLQNQNSIEQDSTRQLSFEMSKYLVQDDKQDELVAFDNNKMQFDDDQIKKQQISGEIPTFICTPNKEEEKVTQDYFAKTKTSKKTQQIQQNQRTFSDIIKQLDMKVIQDLKPQVLKDQFLIFNKLCNSSSYQLEDNLMYNIPINSHQKIRKQILHHVKHQFYTQNQVVTSLKEKQINFIGFLIDSRSRVSRKKNFKDDLNLRKLLKNEEINYLKNFTQFLKPNSLQTKF